jgi:hypothetical protein
MDLDLMIDKTKVNLRENLCSSELIEKEINAGQWILVLYSYRVEWSVIDAQTLCLVLFRHKDSRATPRRTVGLDVALVKQFL